MRKPEPKRGPGRPALPEEERMRVVAVRIDPDRAAKATRIGSGNISEGIRRAIDRWRER